MKRVLSTICLHMSRKAHVTCNYSPKATYRFGRVLDLPKGSKERPSRGRLWLRRKWTDLDEIWNVVSQMLEAGHGRLWAPSAHDSLRGSRIFV